jgi:hypothetical protein
VIKPKPVQPAMPGGFTIDDFATDEQADTVTCPAGVTRPITPSCHVVFGAACRACPPRERCTTSKSGRAVTLHRHDGLLRAARANWAADPALREDHAAYRPTPNASSPTSPPSADAGSSSVTAAPLKNHAWLNRCPAALNLRNLAGRASPAATAPGSWPPDQPAPGPPGQEPQAGGAGRPVQATLTAQITGPAADRAARLPRRPERPSKKAPEAGLIQQAPKAGCGRL